MSQVDRYSITLPSDGPEAHPDNAVTLSLSHKQAIVTRYHGPGNVRGSRITAQCAGGKITVPYDHALDSAENHLHAAAALAARLGWRGTLKGGYSPTRGDLVFVFVD